MDDALLEVQGAIVTLLRGDATLAEMIAGRVYDQVPADAVFPYVSLGPSDAIEDDAECIPTLEITQQVDVWSRATGYPEAKRLAGAVRGALHSAELDLAENAAVLCEHRQTRALRDPDGLTTHMVLTFRVIVETA